MSNTSLNFLANSFLLTDTRQSFNARSLTELENELDRYRDFIASNTSKLDEECLTNDEDSVLLSDFGSTDHRPDFREITAKSLFINQFIIDDPLYGTSHKNMTIINADRNLRGFPTITENEIKNDIWGKAQYIKSLVPGVNADVEYIKFYPLSKAPTNELLHFIQIPELSFPIQFPEIYKWFEERVIIKKVDDSNHLVDLEGPCKKLGISFRNDEGFDTFLPAYLEGTFQPGSKGYVFKNVVPSSDVFETWKREEIIKSIRDRYEAIIAKNEYRIKFGAILSTESRFEDDFFSSVLGVDTTTVESRAVKVATHLSMPSIQSASFENVMEVRKVFDEEFNNFRKQLADDVIALRNAGSKEELESFSKDLSAKYESKIKEIKNRIRFRFKFSQMDLIPASIDLTAILASHEPVSGMLTGINLLYKMYQGVTKPRAEAKQNTCYFLYRLSR